MIVVSLLVGMLTGAQCTPQPTPADGAAVMGYGAALLHCQAVGIEAGTYKAYAECAGYIDGGSK